MIYELLDADGNVTNTIVADADYMAAQYAPDAYREVVQTVTPPAPPAVPQVVSMRQARLALLAADLLDDVDAAVKAAGRVAQIEWDYATEVRRDHPLIAAIQAANGLTSDELDALFAAASSL